MTGAARVVLHSASHGPWRPAPDATDANLGRGVVGHQQTDPTADGVHDIETGVGGLKTRMPRAAVVSRVIATFMPWTRSPSSHL
jgi:hypothetical protein